MRRLSRMLICYICLKVLQHQSSASVVLKVGIRARLLHFKSYSCLKQEARSLQNRSSAVKSLAIWLRLTREEDLGPYDSCSRGHTCDNWRCIDWRLVKQDTHAPHRC